LTTLVTARGKIDARDGISDISLAASGTAVNEQDSSIASAAPEVVKSCFWSGLVGAANIIRSMLWSVTPWSIVIASNRSW